MREKSYPARERSSARAAAWPLGLIAAVFVLPTYSSCDGPFRSPAHYASGEIFMALWVTPVFLVAGLLALLTVRSLRRGDVDAQTRRLGLASVSGFAAILVALGAFQTFTKGASFEWPWLAAALVGAAAAGALIRHARGMRPWQIWEHLLAAFCMIAAATGPSVVIGGDLLRGSLGHLGPGAYLFIGAQLLLWVILGRAVVRSRWK